MIIVFGSSGYIGRHIHEYFYKKDNLLFGTSNDDSKKEFKYFDLQDSDLNNLNIDTSKAGHAFICSAISKPDECKKNEEKSYKINVAGTKKLIEQLWQKNIFPIWFSSEQVFDGKKGKYTEDDERNPISVYGRQKKIIEDFLLGSGNPFLIARVGRAYGLEHRDNTLITSLLEQFKNSKVIRCAADQIFSPIYIEDLVKLLDICLEKNLSGIYNFASPEAFSRLQLANMLKSQLGLKSSVAACSIRDFKTLEQRPLDTSLNVNKLIRDTGFKFTKIEDAIGRLKNIQIFEKI